MAGDGTITLGFVVGVIALVAGVLRLGFASFISEPVLKGFSSASLIRATRSVLRVLIGAHRLVWSDDRTGNAEARTRL